MRRACFIFALALTALGLSSVLYAENSMKYPPMRRIDQVDDYHGVKVADPYRWLEDDVRKSKDVADWVAAENKVTFAYLEARSRSARRSASASPSCGTTSDTPRRSRPAAATSTTATTACRTRTVLYVTGHARRRAARCCSTRTSSSKDGTVALSGIAVSHDGKYLAYGTVRGRLRLADVAGPGRRHPARSATTS